MTDKTNSNATKAQIAAINHAAAYEAKTSGIREAWLTQYPLNPQAQAQALLGQTNIYGAQPRVAELTAQAIRVSGLTVAEQIRELAKKAKDEGEALAAMAEEAANKVIQASSEVADRINAYLVHCGNARAIIQGQTDNLQRIPDPEETQATLDEQNHSLEAVERAILEGRN